jgi:phage major head subunit gpT-like protein
MALKITTSLLETLNTTVRATFMRAYDSGGAEAWHPRVCAMVPSGSASNTYPFSVDAGPVREWESGERVIRSLELGSYQVFNKRYEKTVGINRDHLEDDQTGALLMRVRDVAQKFSSHPDEMVAAIISANPVGLDGDALFSATHPRNPATPVSGQSFANLFGSKALTKDNLMDVRKTMRSRIGPDGLALRCNPRLLLVPPSLEYTAMQITRSMFVPSTAGTASEDNVIRGMFDVLVVDQLESHSNGATNWYLADVSTEDKPFIMQTRDPFQLTTQFDPKDPSVFNRNEYVWGGTVRYGFGPGNPLRISKCQVAAL